ETTLDTTTLNTYGVFEGWNGAGTPPLGASGYSHVLSFITSNGVQLGMQNGVSGLAVRSFTSGTWNPWNRVWHSGDFTSSDISNWYNKAELSDINNSTITINTGTGLDGGSTFTLNQSSNKTINLKAVWAATPEW